MKFLTLLLLLISSTLSAHPMPHSLMLMDIKGDGIQAQLSLPLKEFQLVFPGEDLDSNYQTLINRKSEWLNAYLLQHLSLTDTAGNPWVITIQSKSVSETQQPLTGKYHQLTYQLWLKAPTGSSPRNFIMYYSAIMHQLITHKLFIKISADWYSTTGDTTQTDIGVLSVNPADNSIPPVIVNLNQGSAWSGFKKMVALGMHHIAEGTDHLLFLIVLLLPATLIAQHHRWAKFGGGKYSVMRLLKIITAFTIGHSISLILGSTKILALPQQPVEVAIGITILITAVHAIRPIFYGKEIYVAAVFGLIHGLAFSTVLAEMNLDPKQMAFSILGFNIGIELMQLFVVLCTVPWLIIISRTNAYRYLRITGALCATIAALGFITERITSHPNPISLQVETIATYSKWFILALALTGIATLLITPKNNAAQAE